MAGRPLGSYAVLTAAFNALLVGGVVAARRSGRRLPKEIAPQDVVLLGVATHKASRLITKAKVTAFIRAPFAQYEGPAGQGEVEETPKGTGLRRAIGELLTCPYCIGMWVAGAFSLGFVFSPRVTRLVAAILTAKTIADTLSVGYGSAKAKA